jgi:mycothione reductase
VASFTAVVGRRSPQVPYRRGVTDFDLVVIGSGSGNSLITPAWDDRRVALVESGTFGGTCLNVGCIPTKMFVYAAEVARSVRDAGRFGVDAHIDRVRWGDIRDRIFGRIDPLSADDEARKQASDNVSVFRGVASFDGPRSIAVDTAAGVERFTGRQIVIAAGSRPVIPDVIADAGVAFHTSNSIMRIEELPASMVILGGGYVAAEFAHVFASLGVRVRIVTRGSGLLTVQDREIGRRFTALAQAKWDVHLDATVTAAHERGEGVELTLADGTVVGGGLLLVATGRKPNSDRLALPRAGVEIRRDGRILVDEFGRTTADEVWALGDVSSPFQLKHVANAEARAVGHNLLAARTPAGTLQPMPHRFVPSAVFTDPQIATVGATEQVLQASGRRYVSATQSYGDTAFGWAMEDRDSICRLHADPDTGLLLGAHLMGDQAATLIQPLIQAMTLGQTVKDMARGQYWIHPALTEVVENALLKLPLAP